MCATLLKVKALVDKGKAAKDNFTQLQYNVETNIYWKKPSFTTNWAVENCVNAWFTSYLGNRKYSFLFVNSRFDWEMFTRVPTDNVELGVPSRRMWVVTVGHRHCQDLNVRFVLFNWSLILREMTEDLLVWVKGIGWHCLWIDWPIQKSDPLHWCGLKY